MKLVKEILYEKFSSESDPIQDMGIGLSFHTLKPGMILKAKKEFYVGPRTNFSSSGIKILKDSFLVVFKIAKTPLGNLKVWYYNARNYKQAKEVASNINLYQDIIIYANSMTGSIKQFENRLTIIPESMYEKFAPESDPIKDMGVGIDALKEKIKIYQFPRVYPSTTPSFRIRKELEKGFGLNINDIYFIAYINIETEQGYYGGTKKERILADELGHLTREGKEIYSKLAKSKWSPTIRIYKTKVGKIATFYSSINSGMNYLGDAEATLKLHKLI